MSSPVNSQQTKNQIVYFFSGVPTVFVCPACETTADYEAVVRNKPHCLECERPLLSFTANPIDYAEALPNEGEDGKYAYSRDKCKNRWDEATDQRSIIYA